MYIKNNFGFLVNYINKLESYGVPLQESLLMLEKVQNRLSLQNGAASKIVKKKIQICAHNLRRIRTQFFEV